MTPINPNINLPFLVNSLQRKDAAQTIINRRTLYATGLGLIPIPMLDTVTIAGLQLWMIRDIAKVYEIPFKQHIVKSCISSLVGNMGTLGMIKLIPGLGSLLGGGVVSASAATATYALGQIFMQHFDQGGTLLDFDPIKSKAYFQQLYAEGKTKIETLKEEETKPLKDYKEAIQYIEVLKNDNETLKEQNEYYLEQQEINVQSVQELQEISEKLKLEKATQKDTLQTITSLLKTLKEEELVPVNSQKKIAQLQQSNAKLEANVLDLKKQLKVRNALLFLLPLLLLLSWGLWSYLNSSDEQQTMTKKENIENTQLSTLETDNLSSSAIITDNSTLSKPSKNKTIRLDAAALNFAPTSTEGIIADYLSKPASTYPKTFWMPKIYFEVGANEPSQISYSSMNNLVVLMENYPNMTLRIYGEIAQEEDETRGIKRAEIIKQLLNEKGVENHKILTSYIIKKLSAKEHRCIEVEVLNK